MSSNKSVGSEPGTTSDAAALAKAGVGTGDGYSGQEYDANSHAGERWIRKLDKADPDGAAKVAGVDRRDMGTDTGKRATVDSATGAVHGSGSGAGGGNPGEDYDSDAGGDEQLNQSPNERP